MELPLRKTRGKRMKELMGEEEEADAEFWGQDFFAEEARDIGYETESEVSDTLDSDFSDPEVDDEDNDAVEPEDDEKKKKKLKPPGYKPQTKKAARVKIPRELVQSTSNQYIIRKSSRSSVVEATAKHEEQQRVFEQEKKRREDRMKASSQASRRPQHIFMKELLTESQYTEARNAMSLQHLLEKEEEAKRRSAMASKKEYVGPSIKYHSYRGVDNLEHSTLSYINGAQIPDLRDYSNHNRQGPKCFVTGLAAKYQDPVTKKYYANAGAFKKIREMYESNTLGEKGSDQEMKCAGKEGESSIQHAGKNNKLLLRIKPPRPPSHCKEGAKEDGKAFIQHV